MSPPPPAAPGGADGTKRPEVTESSDQPLTILRGASVEFDSRKVGRVVVALCLITLGVLAVVFTVVGVQKNSQINRLREHGVAVTVTVTGCQGLLGGSGTNVAGYACHGTYRLGGQPHSEAIPGTAYYAPGSTLRAVSDPDDPALLSTISMVRSEHASWRVFILPAVLLVALALAIILIVIRRRPARPGQ